MSRTSLEFLSAADAERIAAAIADAERETAGEIVAVLTRDSSSYLYAPFLWAAIAALLVPWPLIYFTWWPSIWVYGAQLGVFILALALLFPRPVRVFLVPGVVKRAQARRRAREQFLAQNLHTTAGRTGVLIFVSIAEHYAEILADAGIDAKVPKGTWREIISVLTREIGGGRPADGFVKAVAAVGGHLAQHFPPGTADPNELPNHLIVLAEGE